MGKGRINLRCLAKLRNRRIVFPSWPSSRPTDRAPTTSHRHLYDSEVIAIARTIFVHQSYANEHGKTGNRKSEHRCRLFVFIFGRK
jgi:hypothetical protein